MPGLQAVFAAGFAQEMERPADDPVAWRQSGVISLPDSASVPTQILWRLSQTRRGRWEVRVKRFCLCADTSGYRRRDEAACSLEQMPQAPPTHSSAIVSPDGRTLMIFVVAGLGDGACIYKVEVPVSVRTAHRRPAAAV